MELILCVFFLSILDTMISSSKCGINAAYHLVAFGPEICYLKFLRKKNNNKFKTWGFMYITFHIHAYVRTYIHTHIRAYIHTYIYIWEREGDLLGRICLEMHNMFYRFSASLFTLDVLNIVSETWVFQELPCIILFLFVFSFLGISVA